MISRLHLSVAFAIFMLGTSAARAADHYAVVLSGASGGAEYADRYRTWRQTFVRALGELEYSSDRVFVLADDARDGARLPTRENVRSVFSDLEKRVKPEDLLVVLLIGHGITGESDEAKFNLVGPDLTASEWANLVKPIAGRVVFVNAASGSFPFLRKLSGPNRVVVTAVAASAQQYETVFPEFFVAAFAGLAADGDRSGKVSIWEAFTFTTDRVRRWFEERGQLTTERALLDDNADGIGREARAGGSDGRLASTTFLQPELAISEPADTVLGVLLRRRAALDKNLDALRVRRTSLTDAEYQELLEPILLEIARLDRQIKSEKEKGIRN
jgi:hypothetical protein